MPIEAFKTYDRTVMSHFIKPLEDQVMRAFQGTISEARRGLRVRSRLIRLCRVGF